MIVANKEIYFDTKESVERMQDFNVEMLPRDTDLCDQLSFHDPVRKFIELYKRLSVVALEDVPDDILTTIQANAKRDYQVLQKILDFDLEQNNSGEARITLLNHISAAYQSTFNALHQSVPTILYRRSTDFQTSSLDIRTKPKSAELTEQEYNALLEP